MVLYGTVEDANSCLDPAKHQCPEEKFAMLRHAAARCGMLRHAAACFKP